MKNTFKTFSLLFVILSVSLISYSQDNLLTNGDFENGTTGWQVWSADMEISSDAHEGYSAAFISNRNNPWDALARDVKPLLENGQTYTIEAWVKMESQNKAFRITLGMKVDGVNSYTSLCRTDNPGVGSYEFYTQNFTVDWNGNLESANIYFETEEIDGVYTNYLVDDVVLKKYIPEQDAEITSPGFKDIPGQMLYGGVIGGDKNYFNNKTAKAQVLNDCEAIQITCYPAWGRWDENKKHVYHVEEFSERIREMKKQNLNTTAHMLMGWDKYYPEWFRKGDFEVDTLDAIMKSWLKTIITYEGNDTLVDNWNVVNEAISWDGRGGYHPLFNENYESACEYQRMGFEPDASGLSGEQFVNAEHPVYIRKAFEYARTLTDKKLELRDSGFEFPNRSKYHAFYQLAKHLKEVGAPVDVIGFQTHLNINETYDWEAYTNNIKRYIDLGYEVIIPEVDIGDTEKDWTEEKAQAQKRQYYNLVTAAIKGGATQFQTWGFIDNNETGWRYGESAFPYAKNFEKKPAHFGIMEALIDMSSILFWEMNENVKDTMPDVMSYNNFGKMNNFDEPVYVQGYKKNALQFDGVDDFISTPSLSKNITEDFTFSCFIKTSSTEPSVIAELLADTKTPLEIGINDEGKVYVNGTVLKSGKMLEAADPVNDGIWHFIALQRDSINYKLYVDDYNSTAIEKGNNTEFKNIMVGAKSAKTHFFNGAIDEIKLYDWAIEEKSFERNYLIEDQYKLDYKFSRMRVKTMWDGLIDEQVETIVERKIGDGEWVVVAEVEAHLDYYIETVDLYDTTYTYRVRSASRFANSGSSNEVVVVTPSDPNTTVFENAELDQIKIFPNPTSGILRITNPKMEDSIIEILNLNGVLLETRVLSGGKSQLNISNLESGIYFIRSNNNTQRIVLLN